jgi:hypothetical protein
MSSLVPTIHDGDWSAVRKAIQKLATKLGPDSAPTYSTITLTDLTASRIVASDANKALESVDLVNWIAGTTDQITVTDDVDGSVTLSLPQDYDTGATPTLGGLTIVNAITEFSTDGTMAGDSDSAVPTEKAVKAYIDGAAGGSLDHGLLAGLSDNDHTQYILHSLADAANDFLVASGADVFVKKTLAETGAILEGDIEHDNLQSIPANDHIDHTGVTLTAGTGLTGGGDISANRTFNVDVGIADDKILQVDDADAADNDYAKFTANGLEGRDYSEVKTDLSLDAGADVTFGSLTLADAQNVGSDLVPTSPNTYHLGIINFEWASLRIGTSTNNKRVLIQAGTNHVEFNFQSNGVEWNSAEFVDVGSITAVGTLANTGAVNIVDGAVSISGTGAQLTVDNITIDGSTIRDSGGEITLDDTVSITDNLNMNSNDIIGISILQGEEGLELQGDPTPANYPVVISSLFRPDADNTIDLGAVGGTDYRFRHLYLSGNLSDETNTLTVANAKAAYDHKVTEDAINGLVFCDGGGNYSAKTIGTDVQAYDAGLTNLAAVAMAADKFYYTSADNVHVAGDVSAFARTILDDAAASNVRDTIGLGTADYPQFDGMGLGTARVTSNVLTIIDTISGATVNGIYLEFVNSSALPAVQTRGLLFDARLSPNGNQIIASTALYGCNGIAKLQTDGNETSNVTLTSCIGYYALVNCTKGGSYTATVTNGYAFYATACTETGGGTIGTMYAFYDAGQAAATTNWGLGINTQSYINANLRIGSTTAPTVALDVTGEAIINDKAKITSIGGYAIKLTNETGGNSVAGQLVRADTANNDAVILTAASDVECLGVFLDGGVADGSEAWVVVAGIADVAMTDNTAATRCNWVETSAEAGYADATNATPVAAPTHFREIGHCIETVAAGGGGTHINARCVLHFN